MRKRNSLNSGASGSNNSLLNYFSKSPATPKTPKSSSLEDPNKTPSSSKVEKISKIIDKKPIENDKNASDDSEEEICAVSISKRRRIIAMDSDSDQENSSSNVLPSEKVQSIKEKSIKAEIKKTPPSSPGMPRKKFKSVDESMNFEEKLKNLTTEGCAEVIDSNSEENADTLLDVPVVWTHNKLEFLKAKNLKDKKGKKPDHPDYDPTTLFVPTSYLDGLTPGLRQWWEIKSENFDCVLFFKVGKFYELYHMDAEIGVQELGFTFMRGEFAHSGFPEQSYNRMASSLVSKGYKVARIEQTETPDMMQDRVKTMKKTTKFDRVVKREVCQITNRGTEVFGQQVHITNDHQPNYMLAVVEKIVNQTSRFGVCFIDTSLAQFHIGEFDDDKQCSRLLTLLSHYPCVLALSERNGLSARTTQIFKTTLSSILKEQLLPERQFWTAQKTLKTLAEKYYSDGGKTHWPEIVKLLQDEGDHLGLTPSPHYTLALRAFGACIWYLMKCLIDQQIMAMARYSIYVPPDNMKTEVIDDEDLNISLAKKMESMNPNRYMVLDSITLSNLKLTNDEWSLVNTLDQCCTKFGKRLLHYWVCTPSSEKNVIVERQDAIREFMENNELLEKTRTILGTLPDLERLLAQIHTFGNAQRSKNHPDGRAILFEQKQYNKKKIQDFIAALNGFDAVTKIPELFKDCSSIFLKRITQMEPNGKFPNISEKLDYFKTGFDHAAALKEGIIAPGYGVDKEYDNILDEIKSIEVELADYLKEQEKRFGCRINYFGNDKKRFQLEIPENYAKKADSRYSLEGQKKGSKPVKRYHTEETRDLLKRMLKSEDDRNAVLRDLSRRMFERFSNHYSIWKVCIELVATLDILTSLAVYGQNQNQICFPEILDFSENPIIEIDDGYHPCIKMTEDFIPNGLTLGGPQAPLALLTGPNMGGKSTLMRQVGLLIVMSQMGCPVPANSCRLSLVDRIFTRLGAQDDIMAGQSTFLVELSETSAILKHATVHSLVLLDELGRGTATYDGTAIAVAVVNFLANLKCRTLFSTHYHNLVDNFHDDKRVSLGHMSCMVENEDNDDPTQETVTFLYKYSDGACPKSYGFNAAKLAGMPKSIIKRAYALSKKVESTALKRKLFSKILLNSNTSELKDLLIKLKSCAI